MMMPTVDVIVPCFNYGRHLAACVDSVLSQHGVAVRVLIMDDASSDDTERIGRRLAADRRVEFRRHQRNVGHIATYNEALRLLTADACLLLSADDLLTPGALARAVAVLQSDGRVGFVYGRDIPFRDGAPLPTPSAGAAPPRVFEYDAFLRNACRLGQTGIQSPTVVVRTTLHRAIGDYLPELPHSGDTEIWLRMAAAAPVAVLDADQAYRRLHAANMSLGYTPVQRLAEQVRAFDIHFDRRGLPPHLAPLRAVARRSIAEAAVWSASRAFEADDFEACDEFLAFATQASPGIEAWRPFRRVQWKRRLGPAAWRLVLPIIGGARRLARAAGRSSA